MNCSKINNFKKDMDTEKKVARFLDDNFYSQISAQVSCFGRAVELSDQYAGIDLSVGSSLIDEKVKNSGSPNLMKDWFCSVEIYQTDRRGDYTKGWFTSDKMKTTHYAFLYNFEDQDCQTSSVIMVMFKKKDLVEYLDKHIGMSRLIEDASKMRYAKKGTGDRHYTDLLGARIGKLTRSYEGATVFAFRLSDFEYIGGTVVEVKRGKKMHRMTFKELKERFN